ncbi:MAG: LLM class F420-dependent oxidoreductase [Candidatus Binatia bacterium]|nr:LLM class F420-dependent oxidoreductase [Candidatus Binatia bacterium]
MKIGTMLNYAAGFREAADEIAELEKSGLDTVWVAEPYGFDAVSQMGYLAAKTERVEIASGVLPIYTRTPSLLAMSAAGVDALSEGRCILGLGTSGPQVIEGFHGVPFDAPVARIREIIEICRKVWRREVLTHEGPKYPLPLPAGRGTGLAKPLKILTRPVRDDIPIVIAALAPKSVEQTAALADGWLPVFYHPTKARNCWGDALDKGAARRDPSRPPMDVYAGGLVGIGEGLESLRDRGRPGMALYVGGMGARGKNFYNDIFASYGYREEAARIQDLYLSGEKAAAADAIPSSFLEETTLVGPESFVAERLAEYAESGVTALNVSLVGDTVADRARTLEKLKSLL